MNIWIRVLNFSGGSMVAFGSLWFLNATIQLNTFLLDVSICANSQGGCPEDLLNKKKDIIRKANNSLFFYTTVASLGAGLACLRESKN